MSGTRRQSDKQTASGILTYEKKLYEDLHSFYAEGSEDASDDWEKRWDWMLARAHLNCGMAHGSREAGILIQQARLKHGYRLNYSDLEEYVFGKGWSLDETIAHLKQPFGRRGLKVIHEEEELATASTTATPAHASATKKIRSLLPVPSKPTTKLGRTLRAITEEEDEGYVSHQGRGPEVVGITFQTGRHDLPEMYDRLAANLDVGTEAQKLSVTALVIERSTTLPMPVCIAQDWQKEATVVLRVLVRLIDQKLEGIQAAEPETPGLESLVSFQRRTRKG
ncbi:hypothetical protein PG994_012922 [Apiospora phragmitis]|uniref:Uncharacterized protein n=1 Tax=Apiospora phragmitis TaxID=2905665 RepID=A0ABR1T9D7_9PEZI